MGLTKGQLTAIAGLLERIEEDEVKERVSITGTATVSDLDGDKLATISFNGEQHHTLTDVIA